MKLNDIETKRSNFSQFIIVIYSLHAHRNLQFDTFN